MYFFSVSLKGKRLLQRKDYYDALWFNDVDFDYIVLLFYFSSLSVLLHTNGKRADEAQNKKQTFDYYSIVCGIVSLFALVTSGESVNICDFPMRRYASISIKNIYIIDGDITVLPCLDGLLKLKTDKFWWPLNQ